MTDEMREVIISFMENVKGCVDLLDDQYYVRDCIEYHDLERDITRFNDLFIKGENECK